MINFHSSHSYVCYDTQRILCMSIPSRSCWDSDASGEGWDPKKTQSMEPMTGMLGVWIESSLIGRQSRHAELHDPTCEAFKLASFPCYLV